MMARRRSRGDGGLHFDSTRQRWIAEITVGYRPGGKRIVRHASGVAKTAAQRKLRELLRDNEDGLPIGPQNFTVSDAVQDWLRFGLGHRDPSTAKKCRLLAERHIIPAIGARKLRDLTADDVDRWLAAKATILSTDTLRQLRSILKRSVARAGHAGM